MSSNQKTQKIPLSLDSIHDHSWAQNCHTETVLQAVIENCCEEMVLGQQGGGGITLLFHIFLQ